MGQVATKLPVSVGEVKESFTWNDSLRPKKSHSACAASTRGGLQGVTSRPPRRRSAYELGL